MLRIRAFTYILTAVALWTFLGRTLEWAAALTGLLIALALLQLLRTRYMYVLFVPETGLWGRFMEAPMAVLRYGWVVAYSNFMVGMLILNWKQKIQPAILRVHTGEMGDLEQTMLANSITLTPGTISLEFSPDRQYLYVHVLDVHDTEITREQLRQHLEVHFGRGLRWWRAP